MTKKEIKEEELKEINGGKEPETKHQWYCEKDKLTHGIEEDANRNPDFVTSSSEK